MPLIESLLLLLLLSRNIGEISEYCGQPAMLGEVAAGDLLGPSILGVVRYTPEIQMLRVCKQPLTRRHPSGGLSPREREGKLRVSDREDYHCENSSVWVMNSG
ncbi:MAG: hypothetical protein ABSG32_24520 [Terriglobia bacterium]